MAIMPSPATSFTVPSKRCTASIILQGRIEECLAGFWIKVTDQFGRTFEVGKQHGDLFALALHGASGGEDLLDQVECTPEVSALWMAAWVRGRGRGGVAGPDQHFCPRHAPGAGP